MFNNTQYLSKSIHISTDLILIDANFLFIYLPSSTLKSYYTLNIHSFPIGMNVYLIEVMKPDKMNIFCRAASLKQHITQNENLYLLLGLYLLLNHDYSSHTIRVHTSIQDDLQLKAVKKKEESEPRRVLLA